MLIYIWATDGSYMCWPMSSYTSTTTSSTTQLGIIRPQVTSETPGRNADTAAIIGGVVGGVGGAVVIMLGVFGWSFFKRQRQKVSDESDGCYFPFWVCKKSRFFEANGIAKA